MTPKVQEAARRLNELFLSQFVRREAFSIGMSWDELHVYARAPERRWPVEAPKSIDGVKIEWHWNCGKTIAQQS